MKAALLIPLLALLTGCAALTGLVQQGAAANDAAAQAAEVTLCRGISIGAWRRAYGADPARATAWKALCADQLVATP